MWSIVIAAAAITVMIFLGLVLAGAIGGGLEGTSGSTEPSPIMTIIQGGVI